MNKREAAILSAYTGIMLGSFSDLQAYAEEKLDRPIWTHQFADKDLVAALKAAAHDDFIEVMKGITDE